MSQVIKIEELDKAISEALEEYDRGVIDGLKKTTTRAMKDLVKNTKATAPVGRRERHYRDNITSRTESETMYGLSKLWYVKGKDYRLSHLLNNGHAMHQGGRYPGTNFIGKAVDVIEPWYVHQIEEVLKNGK